MNVLLGTVAGSINISVSPVGPVYDVDALTYIQNVETADGQGLEEFVKTAINTFVVDLKTDGIWSNISSCGILAGARTLSGALITLKGPTLSAFNFTSADYTRYGGLSGDGITKYLDTGIPSNSRPVGNTHYSVYMSSSAATVNGSIIASTFTNQTSGQDALYSGTPTSNLVSVVQNRVVIGNTQTLTNGNIPGFKGGSRQNNSSVTFRFNSQTVNVTRAAISPVVSLNIFLFARNNTTFVPTNFSNNGATFYSLGSGVNLEQLETRVITLMRTLSTVI